MKYLLAFLFVLVGIESLLAGDVFLLRIQNSNTWRVECKGFTSEELRLKKLVIGNEKFQIRQPLSTVKKIVVSENFVFENGVSVLRISFFDDRQSFSLPSCCQYAMFSDLWVHPEVKNIWISNVEPDMKLKVRYLGNSEKLSGIFPLISISVWLEDEVQRQPASFYWQTQHDMLKVLPSPVKKGNNLSDFIDYTGVFYLHPLLGLETLSPDVQDENHKKQLDEIQQELVWNILRFNNGVTGLESVIDSYRNLLIFYQGCSSNQYFQKKIAEQLKLVKTASSEYKKRNFDAGLHTMNQSMQDALQEP